MTPDDSGFPALLVVLLAAPAAMVAAPTAPVGAINPAPGSGSVSGALTGSMKAIGTISIGSQTYYFGETTWTWWLSGTSALADVGSFPAYGTGTNIQVGGNLSGSHRRDSFGWPSGFCERNGGDRIVDTTTAGVHAKVYTHQPSATDVDVCVRVEDAASGEGYGGKLALTPSGADPQVGSPGTPTTDSASTACTTTTPNMVPGPHPLSFGGVGPVDYMVDAYANGSEAWVCLEVNSTVKHRVKVPLGDPTPDVSVGYVATWYPDPDMP